MAICRSKRSAPWLAGSRGLALEVDGLREILARLVEDLLRRRTLKGQERMHTGHTAERREHRFVV